MTVKLKNENNKIIAIGESHRPGTAFYSEAQAFRAALDKLGLPMTQTIREFAATVTPVLVEQLRAGLLKGATSIRIVPQIEVTYADGSSRLIGSAQPATPAKRKKK